MNIINYVLASIVASSGIFSGVLISRYATEELKQGKKYFTALQIIILGIITAITVYFRQMPYLSVIFAFLFFLKIEQEVKPSKIKGRMEYLVYALFGLLFFEAAKTNVLIAQASLIFIYGITEGSIIFMKKKSNKKLIKCSICLATIFLVVSIALQLILL